MATKKFRGIIVCCENNRSINEALAIKQIFSDLNVNVKINYRCIGECMLKEKREELLVCLSNDYAIKKFIIKKHKRSLGGAIRIIDLSKKDKKLYNSPFSIFVKNFAIAVFIKDESTIIIDMISIKKRTSSVASESVIHELLHLEREKECSDEACVGKGYAPQKSERGSSFLCNNCKKLFKKIIDKYFESKTSAMVK